MSRPKCAYAAEFHPTIKKFIPEGARAGSTGTVLVSAAEAEALRLKHLSRLCQTRAAKKMSISQSSFQRILQSAHRKVSEALIEGKAISLAEPLSFPKTKQKKKSSKK